MQIVSLPAAATPVDLSIFSSYKLPRKEDNDLKRFVERVTLVRSEPSETKIKKWQSLNGVKV